MKGDHAPRITPDPGTEDRAAILAAVEELLRREDDLARPALWKLAGWTQRRVGLTDLRRWIPPQRRWPLSTHLARGGRVFPGLNGRGDAK
ncbi:MAG: hypothetical protein ACRDKJ_09465 [Actinomycetota bacterium]